MSLAPLAMDLMECKLSGMYWKHLLSILHADDQLLDLYGIDLPPVSSIPGVKLTRQKDYHKYCIDIKALTGDNKRSIVENLHLDVTSDHQWLDSIQSWVLELPSFPWCMCSWYAARFPATLATKIKFEIYGHRLGPRKHVAMAETAIQDLLDARDEHGGEQVPQM